MEIKLESEMRCHGRYSGAVDLSNNNFEIILRKCLDVRSGTEY